MIEIGKVKDIWGRIKEKLLKLRKSGEDKVELAELPEEIPKYLIRIEKLFSYGDVDRILSSVKNGKIVLVSVKELEKKDVAEFQNSLVKMRRICNQLNWDIVGIEDGYLIIAPQFAKIERK